MTRKRDVICVKEPFPILSSARPANCPNCPGFPAFLLGKGLTRRLRKGRADAMSILWPLDCQQHGTLLQAVLGLLCPFSRKRADREHGCCFPKVKHHRQFHALYISKWLIFGVVFFLNNHKSQHLLSGQEPFGSVLSQGRERGCQWLLQVLFLVRQLFTSSIPRGNSGSKSDADAFLTKYRKGGEPPHAAWLQLPAPTGMWPQRGGCGPSGTRHRGGAALAQAPHSPHSNLQAGVWKKLFKSSSYN